MKHIKKKLEVVRITLTNGLLEFYGSSGLTRKDLTKFDSIKQLNYVSIFFLEKRTRDILFPFLKIPSIH